MKQTLQVVVLTLTVLAASFVFSREWTATSGHKLTGDFVELKDGNVSIKLPDGNIADVPLDQLCDSDKDFVKQEADQETQKSNEDSGNSVAPESTPPEVGQTGEKVSSLEDYYQIAGFKDGNKTLENLLVYGTETLQTELSELQERSRRADEFDKKEIQKKIEQTERNIKAKLEEIQSKVFEQEYDCTPFDVNAADAASSFTINVGRGFIPMRQFQAFHSPFPGVEVEIQYNQAGSMVDQITAQVTNKLTPKWNNVVVRGNADSIKELVRGLRDKTYRLKLSFTDLFGIENTRTFLDPSNPYSRTGRQVKEFVVFAEIVKIEIIDTKDNSEGYLAKLLNIVPEAKKKETSSGVQAQPNVHSAEALEKLVGVWKGSYSAGQGEAGLTLTIYEEVGNFKAIFDFYNLPGKRNSASGKYYMNVSYNPSTGRYSLRGYEWIVRPGSYTFLNLEGTLSGDVFSGSSNFRVVRVEQAERSQQSEQPSSQRSNPTPSNRPAPPQTITGPRGRTIDPQNIRRIVDMVGGFL